MYCLLALALACRKERRHDEQLAREDRERKDAFEPSQHQGLELRADCGPSPMTTTVEQTEGLRVKPALTLYR